MSQTVKDLYFGHEEISKDTLKQFIKLSGDHMFFGGTEVVVRELVKHRSVFSIKLIDSPESDYPPINLHLISEKWILTNSIFGLFQT